MNFKDMKQLSDLIYSACVGTVAELVTEVKKYREDTNVEDMDMQFKNGFAACNIKILEFLRHVESDEFKKTLTNNIMTDEEFFNVAKKYAVEQQKNESTVKVATPTITKAIKGIDY